MANDTYLHDSFDDRNVVNDDPRSRDKGTTYSIAKVFGYMFIWLLISSAIAVGMAGLFSYLINTAAGNDEVLSTYLTTIIVSAIVSGIAVFILSMVTHFVLFRGRHSIAVPAYLYSIFMGVLLGSLCSLITSLMPGSIGWAVVGISFGITTLMFGVMALVALTSKSKLNALPIVAMGLLAGIFLMSGAMIIIMIFFPTMYEWWYWVMSLGLLVVVMLTTIWDIRNVKTLAERGQLNKNISMYIAFNLYVDFIYILIRVMYFVLRIMGRSRN